jgi:hypothetical protein
VPHILVPQFVPLWLTLLSGGWSILSVAAVLLHDCLPIRSVALMLFLHRPALAINWTTGIRFLPYSTSCLQVLLPQCPRRPPVAAGAWKAAPTLLREEAVQPARCRQRMTQ